MYIYHPKVRIFNKLFINNYYNEVLNKKHDYHYDFIIKGFELLGGSNSNTNYSTNENDPYMFKLLMRKKSKNKEINVSIIENGKPIKKNSKILFYEEKHKNNENNLVNILFLGTRRNKCLLLKIIDNIAYLENLTKEKKCIRNELFPDSNDIEDMINFSIDYCKKNNVKKMLLNDESEFNCNGNKISFAKWYVLLYGNTYYGLKFDFLPQNNKNKIKNINNKLSNKKLKELLIRIDDNDFNEFVKKYNPEMLLQDFFKELRKENKFCYILQEIIDKTFNLFNIKFYEGIMYEKNLDLD